MGLEARAAREQTLLQMPKMQATFVKPMLRLRTDSLPQTSEWMYEIKLDGYRFQNVRWYSNLTSAAETHWKSLFEAVKAVFDHGIGAI